MAVQMVLCCRLLHTRAHSRCQTWWIHRQTRHLIKCMHLLLSTLWVSTLISSAFF